MEAHECIGELVVELALDILVVDILRNRVVNVEKSNSIVACAHTDVFRESTIDVNLTSYRNSTANETAVDIARLETKLAWECWPALVGKGYILT